MPARKVLHFLTLRPAFSTRNLTSLLLVGVFFGVYYLAGGRVTSVPRVESGATFGSVSTTKESAVEEIEVEEKEPESIFAPQVEKRAKPTPRAETTNSDSQDELSDIEARLQRLQKR